MNRYWIINGQGKHVFSAKTLAELAVEIQTCIMAGDSKEGKRKVMDTLRKQTWTLEEALQRLQGSK